MNVGRTTTCGLCDNFGIIDDPANPGRSKKCPECDNDPGIAGLSLAQIVGPPEPGEAEWLELLAERAKVKELRGEVQCLAETAAKYLRWCRGMCEGLQHILELIHAGEVTAKGSITTENGTDHEHGTSLLAAHVYGSLTDEAGNCIPEMLEKQ